MSTPLITICIPAYNRAAFLEPLLDSILGQDYDDFDILLVEDGSPQREAIRAIAGKYARSKVRLTYLENEENLGFDGNLRRIIAEADGRFCMIMGNDDLLKSGVLKKIGRLLERHENVGALLRAYEWFETDPEKPTGVVHYFSSDRFFKAGLDSIKVFYRRVGSISGIMFHREEAMKYFTDKYDGGLFFQMYLCANILINKNGLYINDSVVSCRSTERPDFGNSKVEAGLHSPGQFNAKSRHIMLGSILDIAKDVERERGVKIYREIEKDIANYSLNWLSYLRRIDLKEFCGFYGKMMKRGFWRHPLFSVYFFSVLTLGEANVNRLVRMIKGVLGRTPNLSGMNEGEEA